MYHYFLGVFMRLAFYIISVFLTSQSLLAQSIEGYVFVDINKNFIMDSNEKGLSGVLVSNQKDVVLTDTRGHFEIKPIEGNFIFVTKPESYQFKLDEFYNPEFYFLYQTKQIKEELKYPVSAPLDVIPEVLYFPVYENPGEEEHTCLLMGDPQMKNDKNLNYYKEGIIPFLATKHSDFYVILGDIAHNKLEILPKEKQVSATLGIPGYRVMGNHDMNLRATDNNYANETFKSNYGPNYYSFDYANIHFVMLDTEASDLDDDGEMLSWLKKDLEINKQKWLIAIMHHPPYSKGSHDSDNKRRSGGRLNAARENIIPLLEQAGVDLVFSGHSHMYERSELMNCHYGLSDSFNSGFIRGKSNQSIYSKKGNRLSPYNGTIYAVVGSSSKVDVGPLDHPAMPHSYQEAGSMVVDVNNNILKAYFINKSGKVKDRFEIIKGVEGGIESKECK